jgi:hypothetical protein
MANRLGVSQAQVFALRNAATTRTRKTLRRYVQALGKGFALEVRVRQVPHDVQGVVY